MDGTEACLLSSEPENSKDSKARRHSLHFDELAAGTEVVEEVISKESKTN
jgi:hypothetical protein